MAPVADADSRPPYTKFEVSRPCHSEDKEVSALMGLVNLTFDILTLTVAQPGIYAGGAHVSLSSPPLPFPPLRSLPSP